MAVRRPLIYNANDGMIEMTGSQLSTVALRVLDLYVANNPVVLTAVGSGGNLGTINDTRKKASAMVTNVSSFQNPAGLGTNTIGFSKIQQTLATVSTPTSDLPVYWDDTTGITEMTNADFADTFLAYPFGLLTSGTVGNNSAGTYFISTANSVSGATKIGDVFIDTRANAGAYTSAGITETQDQPTTITTYRLHRRDTFGTVSAYVTPFKINGTIGVQRYTKPVWEALLIEQMRFHATNTPGFRITYNFDGTGTASGSAILNTTLNSNTVGQRQVNANDYRAQRFPSGGNTTANSYQFKIRLN
jgi:hypothetical protein